LLAGWCSPVSLKQEDKRLQTKAMIWQNHEIYWLETEGEGALLLWAYIRVIRF